MKQESIKTQYLINYLDTGSTFPFNDTSVRMKLIKTQ